MLTGIICFGVGFLLGWMACVLWVVYSYSRGP